MNNAEIVESIKELMDAWNKIMEGAREKFPNATPEEVYQIASTAMNRALQSRAK